MAVVIVVVRNLSLSSRFVLLRRMDLVIGV